MITASYHANPKDCPPSYPYLWQDKQGHIWLRTCAYIAPGSRDVCLLKGNSYNIGDITECVTPDRIARRFQLTGTLKLENA